MPRLHLPPVLRPRCPRDRALYVSQTTRLLLKTGLLGLLVLAAGLLIPDHPTAQAQTSTVNHPNGQFEGTVCEEFDGRSNEHDFIINTATSGAHFYITPALPLGVSLNPTSGRIEGMFLHLHDLTHTITKRYYYSSRRETQAIEFLITNETTVEIRAGSGSITQAINPMSCNEHDYTYTTRNKPSWVTFQEAEQTHETSAGTSLTMMVNNIEAVMGVSFTIRIRNTQSEHFTHTINIEIYSDNRPIFNDTVEDLAVTTSDHVYIDLPTAYTQGNTSVQFQGDGSVSYELTPDLPEGLNFNISSEGNNNHIEGIPTASFPTTTYTYTIVDNDGTGTTMDDDRATTTFALEIDAVPRFPSTNNNLSFRLHPDQYTRIEMPIAVSGDGDLIYTITGSNENGATGPTTPALPLGLLYDQDHRIIYGVPTVTTDDAIYYYKATDEDGDTATLEFMIRIDLGLFDHEHQKTYYLHQGDDVGISLFYITSGYYISADDLPGTLSVRILNYTPREDGKYPVLVVGTFNPSEETVFPREASITVTKTGTNLEETFRFQITKLHINHFTQLYYIYRSRNEYVINTQGAIVKLPTPVGGSGDIKYTFAYRQVINRSYCQVPGDVERATNFSWGDQEEFNLYSIPFTVEGKVRYHPVLHDVTTQSSYTKTFCVHAFDRVTRQSTYEMVKVTKNIPTSNTSSTESNTG